MAEAAVEALTGHAGVPFAGSWFSVTSGNEVALQNALAPVRQSSRLSR